MDAERRAAFTSGRSALRLAFFGERCELQWGRRPDGAHIVRIVDDTCVKPWP